MPIIDKISQERKAEIAKALGNLIYSTYDRGVYWRGIYDCIQSHAIYGVSKDKVDVYKSGLEKIGARKFRVVKNNGSPIICFNAEKMK